MKTLPARIRLACFVFVLLCSSSPLLGTTFTNDTLISFDNTNYDGAGIIITNCTVTIDGMHSFASVQVLNNGILTHSAGTNGVLLDILSITNEQQTLTSTNAVPLNNSNAIASTLLVRDSAGMITYSNNVDYLLNFDTNGYALTIQRTDTSAIPDGSAVRLDYQVFVVQIPTGLNLNVLGDVAINAGGSMNVTGQGYGSGLGQGAGKTTGFPASGGGGGYGGFGGMSLSNSAGGIAYGSTLHPVDKGSGGGASYAGPGGSGGGAVLLAIGGAFQVNGTVSANGLSGTNARSGGGAGGSVSITAQTFSGSGAISADGGNGEPPWGGGGGGGRIALYYQSSTFTGSFSARGGAGGIRGGAGTLFTQTASQPGAVVSDNAGASGTNTLVDTTQEAAGPYGVWAKGGAAISLTSTQALSSLLVSSNSWVWPQSTLLMVAGDATIQAGGGVVADGTGYLGGTGPGAGRTLSIGLYTGGGGGYGGMGGNSISNAAGGAGYGSILQPVNPGSGGGNVSGPSPYYLGGSGGGAIQLNVSGTLTVNGRISADGRSGLGQGSGGGSGGSVWLTVGTLSGSGLISGSGGLGNGFGGGGGGGRISIYYGVNAFTGTAKAWGMGNGSTFGGPGTIYTRVTGANVGRVLVDNGGPSGVCGALTTPEPFALTVQGGGKIPISSSYLLGSLLVASNSSLIVSNLTAFLTITGDATLRPGGGIVADGGGYPAGQGPGAGFSSEILPYPYTVIGGGAGYGGFGGAGGRGGATYGSAISPYMAGSGGGTVQTNIGGAGGGALRLSVTGTLTVDGKVSADGGSGVGQNSGGGSGGSVWISAGTLRGAGIISAKGGTGPSLGGGGGGGRISLQPLTNFFAGSVVAYGGNGNARGGAGTIYTSVAQQMGLVMVDNGGQATGTNTSIPDGGLVDVTVQRGARLVDPVPPIRNLVLSSNAWLVLSNRTLNITANAVIPAGCGITADSNGGQGGLGSGRGILGGGGYGGMGAGNQIGGGLTYGSISQPSNPGSGGYNGSQGTANIGSGGAGGGVISISVTGLLSIDGTISANGGNGGANSGGGSGGGILINAGTIVGSGPISANGGAGTGAGGGGGGRIAIYYTTSLYSGSITALGGGGTAWGGAGTIYIKPSAQSVAQVILDNGGQPGTNTSLGTYSGTSDILLRGGAVLPLFPGSSLTGVRNMNISSNSWLLFSNVVQTVFLTGNLTVQPGGGILADGRGYGGGLGTGAGSTSSSIYGLTGGGGAHGGAGGFSGAGAVGGKPYDLTDAPFNVGSGGGNGSGSYPGYLGGSGGGLIQLNVAGTLQNDGAISAKGSVGIGEGSGGGAGGTITLTVGTLAGAGVISAVGGPGNGLGGGGGGGRIAIKSSTSSFTGPITAVGGTGGIAGGAGTIYTKALPLGTPKVIADNAGTIGTNTAVFLSQPFDLTVQNGATVYSTSGYFVLSNLLVGSNATLVTLVRTSILDVAVLGNAVIQPSGGLSADGLGYGQGLGIGAGHSTNSIGSGAGYGGAGGASSQLPGGITYGSASQPIDFGSGGGAGYGAFIGGSEGGGATRLNVAGALTLNGWLSASGNDGAQDDAGGGSGGSVWVSAKSLTGSGLIAADGGQGEFTDGGGGGGGRIAIYSPLNNFTGQASVAGGAGWVPGMAGSIFTSNNFPPLSIVSQTPTGVVSNAVSAVNFLFNTPIDPSSVAVSDFVLQTPSGNLDSSNYTVSVQGTAGVQLVFPSQTAIGDYAVMVGPQITDLVGQQMSQTYTGVFTIALPAIQGQVTNLNGQPIGGVVLNAGSGITPAITDANGNYTIGVPPGFAANVVPSLNGMMFVPGSRYYGNVTGAISNENYLAVTTIGPTLSAGQQGTNVVLSWYGLAGVLYSTFYSTNLVDWVFYQDVSPTNNGPAQLAVPIGTDPRKFFRMQATN